eukprot:828702-Prorocentrum_minimum.AAC.1
MLVLIVRRVAVGVTSDGLVAVLGVELVRAKQPLAGEGCLVRLELLPPLRVVVCHVALRLAVVGHERNARRECKGRRKRHAGDATWSGVDAARAAPRQPALGIRCGVTRS